MTGRRATKWRVSVVIFASALSLLGCAHFRGAGPKTHCARPDARAEYGSHRLLLGAGSCAGTLGGTVPSVKLSIGETLHLRGTAFVRSVSSSSAPAVLSENGVNEFVAKRVGLARVVTRGLSCANGTSECEVLRVEVASK